MIGRRVVTDLVRRQHRRRCPFGRVVVPRVHLREIVAVEHGVAALREAEDADSVVDRIGLRAAPRATAS